MNTCPYVATPALLFYHDLLQIRGYVLLLPRLTRIPHATNNTRHTNTCQGKKKKAAKKGPPTAEEIAFKKSQKSNGAADKALRDKLLAGKGGKKKK